jgi:hypothetical protein
MTQEASARLAAAVTRHREAKELEESTRQELYAAILASLEEGARQVDIVRATGYTREYIRQLVIAARAAGSEASEA